MTQCTEQITTLERPFACCSRDIFNLIGIRDPYGFNMTGPGWINADSSSVIRLGQHSCRSGLCWHCNGLPPDAEKRVYNGGIPLSATSLV